METNVEMFLIPVFPTFVGLGRGVTALRNFFTFIALPLVSVLLPPLHQFETTTPPFRELTFVCCTLLAPLVVLVVSIDRHESSLRGLNGLLQIVLAQRVVVRHSNPSRFAVGFLATSFR